MKARKTSRRVDEGHRGPVALNLRVSLSLLDAGVGLKGLLISSKGNGDGGGGGGCRWERWGAGAEKRCSLQRTAVVRPGTWQLGCTCLHKGAVPAVSNALLPCHYLLVQVQFVTNSQCGPSLLPLPHSGVPYGTV